MKKFLFFLLMLGCVVVAIVFLLLAKLDGIVQTQIEKIGTETLGQPVQVEGVNIDLKSGAGEITGFSIGNPDGFTDPHAFDMERIRLAIDLKSISGDPIVLNEFILEAPVVSLEIREDGSTNLDEILAHLEARKKSEEEKPAEKDTESDASEVSDPPSLIIKELVIAGVQLTLRHPKFGEEAKELVLPDIDLQNVGGEEGVTPTELGIIVVESIAKEGAKAALKAEVGKQAGKLLDKAGSSFLKGMAPAAEEEEKN